LALILNIDTATDIASVCISKDGQAIAYRQNNKQKEHASFVHAAIGSMVEEAEKELKQLDAFGVTAGPGSYTGLRVGLATAKGFCYALNKPLITINTLEVMTQAALSEEQGASDINLLYCPMIDARRMEVFTAIYNNRKETLLPPTALVLESSTFKDLMSNSAITFFGSGSNKFKEIICNANAEFQHINYNAKHLGILADLAFFKQEFSDVAYAQPKYLKEFHSF
jgi:tRNA threonylcarbamoyladenosine biosynthesis protein TsaB